LNADSQTDEGWEKSVTLPPGNYRCYAQAFVRGLYQSDASIVDFSVE